VGVLSREPLPLVCPECGGPPGWLKAFPLDAFLCAGCDAEAVALVVSVAVTLASSDDPGALHAAATLARCLPGRRELGGL
jgi:hypothetical protein